MIKVLELNSVGIGLATKEEALQCLNMPCDPRIEKLDPPAGKCKNPVVFIVYDISNEKAVGTSILYNHSILKNTIEYGCRIWHSVNWNMGYGVDITTLTCNYAFYVSTVKSVNLKVLPTNVRAIRCYEKAGFKFKRNEEIDNILFARMEKRRQ